MHVTVWFMIYRLGYNLFVLYFLKTKILNFSDYALLLSLSIFTSVPTKSESQDT